MERKLVISSKKYREDSVVLSARLPGDLLKKIDEIADQTGRTRNELIQTFLEFAVENLLINE